MGKKKKKNNKKKNKLISKEDIRQKMAALPPPAIDTNSFTKEDQDNVKRMYNHVMDLKAEYRDRCIRTLPKIPRSFLSEYFSKECRKDIKKLAKEMGLDNED